MNILIAPDKFKGSLSARAVATALGKGIRKQQPGAKINIHPLADGGDGSLAVLKDALDLETRVVATVDPLGRPIEASYAWKGTTAYIELAAASGIVLLKKEELNPLRTSTYGTGLLIKDAIERGCQQLYLFLGGSATNDVGFGIAAALGFEFFALPYASRASSVGIATSLDKIVPNGSTLAQINHIEAPKHKGLEKVEMTMLCDVNNPLFGPNGAAHVYAPQKGADAAMVQQLDDGLRSSNAVVKQLFGRDLSTVVGGGAAGGVAAGLHGLLGAKIQAGFPTISTLTNLEAAVQKADLVISGEGKLDQQSLEGKVVSGIAQICKAHHKPLYLVVGTSELASLAGVAKVFSVAQLAQNQQDSMENAEQYLERIGVELLSVGY